MSVSVPLPANVTLGTPLATDHADYPADAAVMQALAVAEDRHFWHASRNAFILRRLRRLDLGAGARILDLGCGGGCVSAALERAGYAVTGVDGHLSRVVLAASRAPRSRFVVHDVARGLGPLGDERFDAVLLLDVIEHLDDAVAALRLALDRAAPGGLVAGTVPALMSLWSEIDVAAGHKRRYTARELRQTVAQAGEVVEVVPFFRHLVPLLWAQRRVMLRKSAHAAEENLQVPGLGLNGLLRGLGAVERFVSPVLDPVPWPGASLWFVLRRAG